MSRKALLLLAGLALACGKTSKNGAETTDDPTGGAGGTPPAEVVEPNCAVSIASDGAPGGARHCAIYEDGSVWCWGHIASSDPDAPTQDPAPARVARISGASRVYLAHGTSCALVSGKLWCWGDNSGGKLTDSGQYIEEPTLIAIGNGQAVRDVGIDREQLCIVDVLSHVYCRNGSRELQVDLAGEPLTRMPGPHTAVIDGDGRIFSLFDPEHPTFYAEARTNNYALSVGVPSCVLKRSGSWWCTSLSFDDVAPPRFELRLGESVVQMGSGDLFRCALTTEQKVWCEGLYTSGEIAGSGYAEGHFMPELNDVHELSIGYSSGCALRADGSVWCWGAYERGEDWSTRQVTGCVDQRTPLAPARITAPPLVGARIAEGGRARAEALCRCAGPDFANEGCADAEDFAPNGACLDALLPNDARGAEAAECLLSRYWDQVECYRDAGCGDVNMLPPCGAYTECTALAGLRSYCRRFGCLDDPSAAVSKRQLCDGTRDCADGSDERNCTRGTGQFDCGDGSLVDVERMCDGAAQCADGSDEAACLQLD